MENQSIETFNLKEKSAVSRLSVALRYMGVLVVIISASCFLIQSWQGWTSVIRYFSFLGLTLLLAATGALCGLKINDKIGARTLLGLLLATIPIHFSQLGALLYSQFKPANLYVHNLLLWEAQSMAEVSFACLLGLACIVPLTYFAQSVFARKEAKLLSISYLVLNAFILIPTRGRLYIGTIIVAMISFAAYNAIKKLQIPSLNTLEGKYVRALMWLPVLFVTGRQLAIYTTGLSFFAFIFCLIGMLVFYVGPRMYADKRDLYANFGLTTAVIGSILLSIDLAQHDMVFSAPEIVLWTYTIPLVIIYSLAAYFSLDRNNAYVNVIYGLLATCALLQSVNYGGLENSIAAITISVITICYSFVLLKRPLLYLGVMTFIAAVVSASRFALCNLTIGPWVGLFVFGLISVVSAALVEKYSEEIKNKLGWIVK